MSKKNKKKPQSVVPVQATTVAHTEPATTPTAVAAAASPEDTPNAEIESLKKRIQELQDSIDSLAALKLSLAEQKQAVKAEVEDVVAQRAVLETDKAALATDRAAFESEKRILNESVESAFKDHFKEAREALSQALSKREADLSAREVALDRKDAQLEEERKSISERESTFDAREDLIKQRDQRSIRRCADREQLIDDEVRRLVEDGVAAYRAEIDAKDSELARLRGQIQQLVGEAEVLKSWRSEFGEQKPAEVLKAIHDVRAANVALDQDLKKEMERYPQDLKSRYDDLAQKQSVLSQERAKLLQEISEKDKALREASSNNAEQDILRLQCQSLKKTLSSTFSSLELVEAKLKEATRAYASPEEESKRHDAVRQARLWKDSEIPSRPISTESEAEWLDGVIGEMSKHGFEFPRRLIQAFHTSLKTAEMAPLTVLSGVSGTGKSELPRLYSLFGGLQFLSVAVQPNWNSPEMLLGYFNPMEERYDSTDALKFLVQAADELREHMCLCLLDEMNLAHPELYFAPFLSKLEERRGCQEGAEPRVGVKVGAGMRDYPVRLGRNVLWTGTMNNDETTEMLSDKVLDRSESLFFPRPEHVVDRQNKDLPGRLNGYLPYKVWHEWVKSADTLTEDEVKVFRGDIDKINECLGESGRALGHRVWQAIRLYMANHPDVIAAKKLDKPEAEKKVDIHAALKRAFEDQLAMKVMPKLRGLDVSGKTKESLKNIEKDVIGKYEALATDFKRAMTNGDDQFVWASAVFMSAPAN